MAQTAFHHWYGPSHIIYGENCTTELAPFIESFGGTRALVVTSRSVGNLSSVIDPVTDGLGEVLGDVYSGVTIEKSYETVTEITNLLDELKADVIVGLGGGSCMDAARAASVIATHPEIDDPMTLFAKVDGGTLVPSNLASNPLPVIEIPTTLSGAEVTCAAGMNITDSQGGHVVRRAPMIHESIWPKGIFYDPTLAIETPQQIIATSGMNGFDHGIEMLYSRNAVPMTDATASHGVRLLHQNLPTLGQNPDDLNAMGKSMVGVALATTGLIDLRTGPKYSLIHAFGHQVAQQYDVQQGLAHAAVAPHVLEYVFGECDGQRELLASAFVGAEGESAIQTIIDGVVTVRDGLHLPSQLREIKGVKRENFNSLADAISEDIGLQFGPEDVDPTTADIVSILESAW